VRVRMIGIVWGSGGRRSESESARASASGAVKAVVGQGGTAIARAGECDSRRMGGVSGWWDGTAGAGEEAEQSEHRWVRAGQRGTGTRERAVLCCRPILRCGFGLPCGVRRPRGSSRTQSS